MHVRDLLPLLLIAVIVIVFCHYWVELDDFPDLGFTLILLQLGHST